MNFAATGLPAWPQAPTRVSALPLTAGDGFALAIDGALSLLAAADGTAMLAGDGKATVVDGGMARPAHAVSVPVEGSDMKVGVLVSDTPPLSRLAIAPAAVTPTRDASPAISQVAITVPSAPANAALAAVPPAPTVPLPTAVEAHNDIPALSPAIATAPTRPEATQDLPARPRTPSTTIAIEAKQAATEVAPARAAALGITIAAAPARPVATQDAPDPHAPIHNAPVTTMTATAEPPVVDHLARPTPVALLVAAATPATPATIAPSAMAPASPALPRAEPVAATPPLAPTSPQVATPRPAPAKAATANLPTEPTVMATVKPPTAMTVDNADAQPIASYPALPSVLAAQIVPLIGVASPRAAAVPAPFAGGTPAPILPEQATGGPSLIQRAANADVAAVAAPPAAKAERATQSAPVPSKPDISAATIVPAPVVSAAEPTAAIAAPPATPEQSVTDRPLRRLPDEAQPADHPAVAALSTAVLPQIVPVANPIPAAGLPAEDAAKPGSARRVSSASSTIAVEPQPPAARDTTPATAPSDAPKFAETPPLPDASAGARPATAPLPTAEPLLPALAPLAEARARAPNPAPDPVITAQPGQIGRDLGVEIARRVSAGGNELVVRLAPADLGRIEVRMSFDDRGGLTTVIAADSPVALDMLRRDSADLTRSLSDAGFRSDGQSLRFDGGGGGGGERSSGQPRTPWQSAATKPGQSGDFGTDNDFEQTAYRPLRTSGRYDLMA